MERTICNKSLLDEDSYTEIVKKTQSIPKRIVISVFGCALILYTLWTMTVFQHILLQGLCALLGVALILMAHLEYRMVAPRGYRQQMTLAAGAPLWFYTEFSDEGIEVTGPTGSRVQVPYRKIKRLYTTPRGLLICMDNRMGMFLSKEGYETGSEEEAEALLREKCPALQTKESGAKDDAGF